MSSRPSPLVAQNGSKKKRGAPIAGAPRESPACLLLPPEAPHQPALNPQVVLVGSAKVGVKVLHLDGAERDMLRQGNICAAAGSHRERIARGRTQPRRTGRELLAAEESLNVREDPSVSREVHPGTEQVVELMRGSARRQAGHFAAAHVPDDANTLTQVGPERARSALAVDARSTAAWVDPDKLIIAGNL